VLRLTGLPAVDRWPRATVRRLAERIEIAFSGPDGTRVVDVDLRYVGAADPEEVELRLLARLEQMGYRVARAPGPEDG
jgi:hypothetical protein